MNILITGGQGFIAKSLQEKLIQNKKYNIYAPSSKELNLIDENEVDNYISKNKIDIVVHTANKGGGRDTLDFKNLTEYNLRMFFNIVKHEKSLKKIISFGSGAEYGKQKPIINVEEQDIQSYPFDEYGFYKAVTSKYIENSQKIIQLRIFGCYGKYENYLVKFITNSIVKNILNLPIIINQNVEFDYLYVNDLVSIIEYFMSNDSKHRVYNLSSGTKIDLVTLANIVNEISSFKSKIIVLNKGLNNEYTSNNQRLKNEITNLSFTSHKEAIKEIYDYYNKNIELIEKEKVLDDEYLEKCNKIWKNNENN